MRITAAAETLAARDVNDVNKVLKLALSHQLGINVPLIVAVYRKDLFTSLSMQRKSIDRSICADASIIRFEFKVLNFNDFVWVRRTSNLADRSRKLNSSITYALQLTVSQGTFALDYITPESKRPDAPIGQVMLKRNEYDIQGFFSSIKKIYWN